MSDLDPEEKSVLRSFERGEWRSRRPSKKEKARYQEYAKATFAKDKRINIRISSRDLADLQKRALEEGLPYQTLVSSVLHKYVTGRLVEKSCS
jgi:predicted DNA binding CopG/RHH family protein